MNAKQAALDVLKRLPDTATWADVEERIRFIAAIEKGREDMAAGRVIADADVRESLREWLTP
jgi:predicted transcriptional regulator